MRCPHPAGAARGYRHAFLEAGLAGERLYLASRGLAPALGVCAVGAFYDDETAELLGIDRQREWPVHVAAVGVVQPIRRLQLATHCLAKHALFCESPA